MRDRIGLNKHLRILFISDLHLGHPCIVPTVMCFRYQDLIYPLLDKIDLLVVNGDLFDSALSLAGQYITDIIDFITDLLDQCIKHGVTILVTRGTFSHDRDQISVVETLARNKGMTDDFQYYNTITATTVLGRKFLILPDDLPYKNSDEIMTVAHAAMSDKGWKHVDYALAHGYFEHVVPTGVHQPKICYRYEQFGFVTRLIDSGHVHTPGVYTPRGKTVPIIYNGSPERTRHGEEESKGCYLVEETDKNSLKIQFIENVNATTFTDCSKDLSENDAILYWTEIFEKHKDDEIAYFKFTHKDIGIRLAIDQLAKAYPNIVYTHRSPNDTNKKVITGSSLTNKADLTYVPTKENLSKDILNYLHKAKRGKNLTIEAIEEYLHDL